MKKLVLGAIVGMTLATVGGAAADDIMVTKAPPPPSSIPSNFNWTGFYAGGHLGVAWGSSNWTAPGVSGSLDLSQPIDTFDETGSFFAGLQGGYNYMLPNRVLIGAEIDASFPTFQNLAGISIGGISNFTSPTLGPESYSETVLSSGTVRGRIGYAPGNWLFYATGGFAWTYDQQTLTQLAQRCDRHALLVAVGLGGRRRRRGPDRAALDGAARISVHRLRQQQRVRSQAPGSGSLPIFRCKSCAPA